MHRLIAVAMICSAFIIMSSVSANAQDDALVKEPVEVNIEGVFSCDYNGKYYIRQIGNEILWFGEDDNVNPTWSNVAHGTINGDIINLIWADVPKGSIMQHGKLVIRIISPDRLEQVSQEGDPFGSNVWNRAAQ